MLQDWEDQAARCWQQPVPINPPPTSLRKTMCLRVYETLATRLKTQSRCLRLSLGSFNIIGQDLRLVPKSALSDYCLSFPAHLRTVGQLCLNLTMQLTFPKFKVREGKGRRLPQGRG